MKKSMLAILMISALLVNSVSAETYTCKSASARHAEKLNKYKLPTFPQLLSDCGLDDLLASFGISGLFELPNLGVLCGYTTQDIADWYGADTSTSIDIDLDIEADSSDIFGDDPLFSDTEN